MLQNKYTNSILYDDDDDKNNTETYTCTFKTEDQIRVPSQKKKYIYLL